MWNYCESKGVPKRGAHDAAKWFKMYAKVV